MLDVRGAVLRYGAIAALDGVDLSVGRGETVAIMGPSGSGKSSLLRVVAGLERPDAGSVWWEGRSLADVPTHRRGFGLMFQDYALFPHRTVAGNVSFGLETAAWSEQDRRSRLAEVLELVGMAEFGGRAVAELSGGEQQRVALARALAPRPSLLMLDEPIGALDRTLRDRLIREFRELFRALDLTVLYVTHDQEEAFTVASRIAVMRSGRIVRDGSPAEIWSNPATEFVAGFLGFDTIVDGSVADGLADLGWARVPVSLPDGRHRFVLRPGALAPSPGGQVRGVVRDTAFNAGRYELAVELRGGTMATAYSETSEATGAGITLSLDPRSLVAVVSDERS